MIREWLMIETNLYEAAAFLWFVFCWLSFSIYAGTLHGRGKNLVEVLYSLRLSWMEEMTKRSGDDRIVDTRIIDNLLRSVTFFASTSIFIIAGLVTLLGYSVQGVAMLSEISFAIEATILMWQVKTLVLIVIFIYAFFKYSWALNQFNYASILIGACKSELGCTTEGKRYATKCATILSNAARHHNMGIRAYYFGLAVLSWYIHPFLFIIATSWIMIVMYRREFMSKTLEILS